MAKATPRRPAKPAKTRFTRKSRKAVPGLYKGTPQNTLNGALNQLKPAPAGNRTVIPQVQSSNVGNQGDNAPITKLRKGNF